MSWKYLAHIPNAAFDRLCDMFLAIFAILGRYLQNSQSFSWNPSPQFVAQDWCRTKLWNFHAKIEIHLIVFCNRVGVCTRQRVSPLPKIGLLRWKILLQHGGENSRWPAENYILAYLGHSILVYTALYLCTQLYTCVTLCCTLRAGTRARDSKFKIQIEHDEQRFQLVALPHWYHSALYI